MTAVTLKNKNITINSAPLAAILGVKPGDTVQVSCKNGVPVTREWRNRFKDAEIDGCITINQTSTKPAKPAKSKEGDK